jgi:hypothetical protein
MQQKVFSLWSLQVLGLAWASKRVSNQLASTHGRHRGNPAKLPVELPRIKNIRISQEFQN